MLAVLELLGKSCADKYSFDLFILYLLLLLLFLVLVCILQRLLLKLAMEICALKIFIIGYRDHFRHIFEHILISLILFDHFQLFGSFLIPINSLKNQVQLPKSAQLDHPISLVNNKITNPIDPQNPLLHQLQHPARRADHKHGLPNDPNLLILGHPTNQADNLFAAGFRKQAPDGGQGLESQLPGGAEDQAF